MSRIPMTGGFTPMREGVQVLRIYGVEYKETFGNLTIYLINAQGETLRETFRFKGRDGGANEGAMNAFSYFAKTAMDDFNMEDVDPDELVGHYIQCEVVHNESNGRTYANLGREKSVAYEFDESPTKEALTKTLSVKPPEAKPTRETKAPEEEQTDYDLDALLG